MNEHRLPVRVYYEDTDCMGVVYHANYLRFMERARSEALASHGSTVAQWGEKGVTFPIYKVAITFKAPARLFDELVVVTSVRRESPFRIVFDQRIELAQGGKLLTKARVDVVCVERGRLCEFPDEALPG